jgi:hypothetical protein
VQSSPSLAVPTTDRSIPQRQQRPQQATIHDEHRERHDRRAQITTNDPDQSEVAEEREDHRTATGLERMEMRQSRCERTALDEHSKPEILLFCRSTDVIRARSSESPDDSSTENRVSDDEDDEGLDTFWSQLSKTKKYEKQKSAFRLL